MRLRDGILTLVDLAKHIGSIKDTDIEGYTITTLVKHIIILVFQVN